MMMNSKPPPRPTPILMRDRRPLPPEPCSPGEEGNLSKSLGDAFRVGGGAMMPLHRQISEVSSITHAGYLYKRSNRPYQQVSPFPLDSLEITVATTTSHAATTAHDDAYASATTHADGTTSTTRSGKEEGGEAERTPSLLRPQPESMDGNFSPYNDNNSTYQQHHLQLQQQQPTRPLHLLYHMSGDDDDINPSTSLASKFNQAQAPLLPLSPPANTEMTESISTHNNEDLLVVLQSSQEEEEESAVAAARAQQEDTNKQQQQQQVALEESLNCAAAFFGINVESAFQEPSPPQPQSGVRVVTASSTSSSNTSLSQIAEPAATTTAATATATKSVPIKVQLKGASNSSFDTHAMHRRSSAPCSYGARSPSSPGGGEGDGFLRHPSRSRPVDYVDQSDNHLWRAKYCVLEEGVLYFYRTKDDAEAQEAKLERKSSVAIFDNNKNNNEGGGGGYNSNNSKGGSKRTEVADLSKSPMPSRSCLILPDGGSLSAGSNSNSDADSTFMWEKRVALNCVGVVRSAETEYGKNTFELLAVDDNEDEGYTNKLVLKAPRQEEVNEWMFQFRCSLASFVKNMVDWLGGATKPSYALGDIHHPGFGHNGVSHHHHSVQTPVHSFNVPAFSPRFARNMPSPSVASLSHGHGRSQLRRRRVDFNNPGLSSAGSVHSVPNTPATMSPTQLQFPLSYVAASSNLVTPLKQGGLLLPEPEVRRAHQQRRREMEDRSPELSAPQYANPPETERPPPPANTGGKYVPPHLRKSGGKYVPPPLRNQDSAKPAPSKYLPPHQRNHGNDATTDRSILKSNIIGPRALSPGEMERPESLLAMTTQTSADISIEGTTQPGPNDELPKEAAFTLGGCADPLVINGSILDQQYIAKKASRVGRVRTDAYGSLGGRKEAANGADRNLAADTSDNNRTVSLEWEIGAVSECGIRDSNEDAFFVTNDLVAMFNGVIPGEVSPTYWDGASDHDSGLFAIFDGHCGNQAARFAAERLPHFLYDESRLENDKVGPTLTEEIMRRALQKLDEEFCRVCVEDGREWESGSTALIAMLANEHLVIASIGDCRGVLVRTLEGNQQAMKVGGEKWNELEVDQDGSKGPSCFWREVADVHSPSRKDEKARIEQAGGWTTIETEIPISQLQRMDFLDHDVVDILRRCFQDRINNSQGSKACSSAPQRILQISRVCGELAVSRAIGDRDFKAACNLPLSADAKNDAWECSLFLPYPDEHNRQFVGNLVSGKPDFQAIPVGEAGIQGEFLLLACDGLWDVMDMDDAVRVTQDLLFKKKCPAKQAAARLAELAIHLGSSDNITVIVIRFFAKGRSR